jgi:hypothetical protein
MPPATTAAPEARRRSAGARDVPVQARKRGVRGASRFAFRSAGGAPGTHSERDGSDRDHQNSKFPARRHVDLAIMARLRVSVIVTYR